MLKRNGDRKISWGFGVYRDPSNLDILTRSLTGTRTDYFYGPTGTNLLLPPVLSTFTINPNQLLFSYVTNASVAFEQKLPKTTYLRVEAPRPPRTQYLDVPQSRRLHIARRSLLGSVQPDQQPPRPL